MLVTALLVLTVLTGCKTAEAQPAISNSQVIKELVPDLPELPAWPKLQWEYSDGRYSLSEADVDKVLDYWENKIPLYQYQMEIYKKELTVILDHL